ncbi:MAG: YitT family protein, partial [Lachnospiraceae bacterium]|nr:YitT family protein [Lachnospiraceae bacterium]
MKFDPKKDIKRILVIVVASFVMALNIKTFVRTGGLYPGGATGLTILIQNIG